MITKEIKIFRKNIKLNIRDDGDLAILHEVFISKQYRAVEEIIKQAKYPILDIGAHLGFFTIFASLLNKNINIYSFEPHEENFKILKLNLKNNHIKNAKIKQLAVSDTIAVLNLHISKEHLNHSTELALEDTGEIQKIQSTTMKRIFTKNRIENCDLIKMDCEGAEFKILYSSPKEIFNKIQNIILEYHTWDKKNNIDKLKAFLEKMGYKVEKNTDKKIPNLGILLCTKLSKN